MKKRFHRRNAELCTALLLSAISFQLTSCGRNSAGAAETTPPEVEVVAVEQKDIPVYREWIGTLDGQVNAAIRSQVTGYLLTQDYSEGSFVKKGQLLFQIDPRPLHRGGGSGAEVGSRRRTASFPQARGAISAIRGATGEAEANQP